MAKYLVETYYNCSFKVSHYLDKVDEKELSNLENRDDGKFEIIDVKLDTRKTKSLEKNQKNPINNEIDIKSDSSKKKDMTLIHYLQERLGYFLAQNLIKKLITCL